ncbi:MAG: IS5 family transposase [Devosia sp.]
MELTKDHLRRVEDCLPVERGNVSMEMLTFLNAVLYVAENGCKWRRLPERFGNWHTIYTRMNRWSKSGVWDRVFARLQQEGLVLVELKIVSLDSTSAKVHPDGTGAGEKNGPQAIGKSRGGWNTKIHLVAADDVRAIGFRLSPGQNGDGPEGRELIGELGCPSDGCALAMDMAYEGDETRGLATLLGFKPVVPPNPQRLKPWRLDKKLYRERNHVERLFRRLKGFRRVFTRYDKLDALFRAFVTFALIWLVLK